MAVAVKKEKEKERSGGRGPVEDGMPEVVRRQASEKGKRREELGMGQGRNGMRKKREEEEEGIA